ncbi:type IV secretory system conjugative DNA transfer family protein [Sphingobium cupriresistens]|nr:TraM recognition domain-containing protein [Sphingobium cupriresistens]
MAMRRDSLDEPLMRLSAAGDILTFRDLAQNIFCTGVTGGGKTSGPGRHLLAALLAKRCGGIILCAKPGEAEEIHDLCAKLGRLDSLIIWDGRNHGFNFLNYMLGRLGRDSVGAVIEYLMKIVELVRASSALRGDNGDAFWTEKLRELLTYLLPLVQAATGNVRLSDILACLRSAPTSLEQMLSVEWQQEMGFFVRCFLRASEQFDAVTGEEMVAFWRGFAAMDAKLRGNILAGFAMLERLNTGWLRNALCGESNLVPELTFQGAIIVLDMSRATHGVDGVLCQMIFKDAWQTAVLARNALPPMLRENFVFCYADECQEIVAEGDAAFLAMSRSSRCGAIYLTQNLPSMYAKLGGSSAHDRVHQLVGNMGTRIFCANHCTTTNQWASETIGKVVRRRSSFNASEGTNQSYGMSMGESSGWSEQNPESSVLGPRGGLVANALNNRPLSENGGDNWGRNRGHGYNQGTSHGWSEQMDWLVPPDFFARGLKVGGPANNFRVSALWVQAARRFAASNDCFIVTEFQQ